MGIGMIVLVAVGAALSLVTLVYGDKPDVRKPPSARVEMVSALGMWFLRAWLVSEFGSYALAPYGIEIGYWQAFFGCSAMAALVIPVSRPKWSEWLAYKAQS